jgi:hypothetical protein
MSTIKEYDNAELPELHWTPDKWSRAVDQIIFPDDNVREAARWLPLVVASVVHSRVNVRKHWGWVFAQKVGAINRRHTAAVEATYFGNAMPGASPQSPLWRMCVDFQADFFDYYSDPEQGEARRAKLAEGSFDKGFLTVRALVAVLSAMQEPEITLLLHEKVDGIPLHESPYPVEDGNPAIAKSGEHNQATSGDDTPEVLSVDRQALRGWLDEQGSTGFVLGDRPCARLGCDKSAWRPYSPRYCPRHFAEKSLQVANRPPRDTAYDEHEVAYAEALLDGCHGIVRPVTGRVWRRISTLRNPARGVEWERFKLRWETVVRQRGRYVEPTVLRECSLTYDPHVPYPPKTPVQRFAEQWAATRFRAVLAQRPDDYHLPRVALGRVGGWRPLLPIADVLGGAEVLGIEPELVAYWRAVIERSEAMQETPRVKALAAPAKSMQQYLQDECYVAWPDKAPTQGYTWVNLQCPFHYSDRKKNAGAQPSGLFKCWHADCDIREIDPERDGVNVRELAAWWGTPLVLDRES